MLLLIYVLMASTVVSAAGAGAGATFTLRNSCPHTVWPAALSDNGGAILGGGGFELPPNTTASFSASSGWSGRVWGRTHCLFGSSSNAVSCATGDCGGALRCSSRGAPPVTLAEFALGGAFDSYDVSLVDGYNVGIGVRPSAAAPGCRYAGCAADVNARCPAELRVEGESRETVACRSACQAFGTPEFCCTGEHGTPETCGPTRYSKLFKAACPAACTYAYDNASSAFTCDASSADYLITFCPAPADADES